MKDMQINANGLNFLKMDFLWLNKDLPDPFKAACKILQDDKEFDSRATEPIKNKSHFRILEGEYCLEIRNKKGKPENKYLYITQEHLGLEMYKQIYRKELNINLTEIKLTPLSRAFLKRQTDTGWGWSLACLLPFCLIYYSVTRRTIVPFIFVFCFYIFLVIIGFQLNSLLAFIFLAFIFIPLNFFSIQKSRKYGSMRLRNMEQGIDKYKVIFFSKSRQYFPYLIRRFKLLSINSNSKKITFDSDTNKALKKLDSLFLRNSISFEELKILKKKILNSRFL